MIKKHILLIAFGFFIIVHGEPAENSRTDQSKRLLLNDADVLGNRLGSIEATLQTLTHTIEELKAKNAKQEAVISSLQTELTDAKANVIKHGSTYIRWGRDVCTAANTELVYWGYASGEKYYYEAAYRGGASNMLCLPSNPELSNKTASGNNQIFGTEYEDNYFSANSLNEDVPCALCRSINTSSSVMFPGRRTCYDGWKEEYNGILASSAYSHNPSPFICVDSHPTYVSGGHRSNDDHLIYVSTMKCGSLPCPPYVDGLQVYCVVCSK